MSDIDRLIDAPIVDLNEELVDAVVTYPSTLYRFVTNISQDGEVLLGVLHGLRLCKGP